MDIYTVINLIPTIYVIVIFLMFANPFIDPIGPGRS